MAGVGQEAGYWQHPGKTTEAFVNNPRKDETFGEILYHTGDIGRWREDGCLEFLGRIDNRDQNSRLPGRTRRDRSRADLPPRTARRNRGGPS